MTTRWRAGDTIHSAERIWGILGLRLIRDGPRTLEDAMRSNTMQAVRIASWERFYKSLKLISLRKHTEEQNGAKPPYCPPPSA